MGLAYCLLTRYMEELGGGGGGVGGRPIPVPYLAPEPHSGPAGEDGGI